MIDQPSMQEKPRGLLTCRELTRRLFGTEKRMGSVYKMAQKGIIPSVRWGPRLGGLFFDETAVRQALEGRDRNGTEFGAGGGAHESSRYTSL